MATHHKPHNQRFHLYNLVFFFVTLFVVFIFLSDHKISSLIETVGLQGGLLSLFIAGMAYSSFVTSPAATAAIFFLGKVYNPFLVAAVGAAGTVVTDYLLFRFFKTKARASLLHLAEGFKTHFKKTRKTLRILGTVVAALIIASPLPDELGIAILGIENYQTKKFLLFSYVMNFIGILVISWLGSVV